MEFRNEKGKFWGGELEKKIKIQKIDEEIGVQKEKVQMELRDSKMVEEKKSEKIKENEREIGYIYKRREERISKQSQGIVGVVVREIMKKFLEEIIK